MSHDAPGTPTSPGPAKAAAAPRRTTVLATVAGFALVATLGAGGTAVLSTGERGDDPTVTREAAVSDLGVRASGPAIRALDPALRAALDEIHVDLVDEQGAEIADALIERVAEEPRTVVGAEQTEQPAETTGVFQRGTASWYGPGFVGQRTASGETYDPAQLTAAHRILPFGTRVRVTNQRNGSSVVVRINDRGPYSGGRIIDLSEAAASAIGMRGSGLVEVTLEIVG